MCLFNTVDSLKGHHSLPSSPLPSPSLSLSLSFSFKIISFALCFTDSTCWSRGLRILCVWLASQTLEPESLALNPAPSLPGSGILDSYSLNCSVWNTNETIILAREAGVRTKWYLHVTFLVHCKNSGKCQLLLCLSWISHFGDCNHFGEKLYNMPQTYFCLPKRSLWNSL